MPSRSERTMIGLRTGMAMRHVSPFEEAENRCWPQGMSARELRINALWLMFFIGAANLTLPIGIGSLPRLVWFPADVLAIAFFLRRQTLFVALARRNALLLSWPLLACASTLWSDAPSLSFYHGLQLLTTMLVGMMLCSLISLTRLLQVLFVSGFVVTLLSILAVLLVPSVAYFHSGEWQGFFMHKNMLGAAMTAQITAGICLFLYGWRRVFVAAAVAIAAFVLLMSGAGSAMVISAIPFILLPLLFAFRKGFAEFVAMIGILIMALAIVLFVLDLLEINIIDLALGKLGKDSTLTGRTILWDFAVDAYDRRPWLGYGYKGYWYGNASTAFLLRAALDDLYMFHNNYIEVAVAFGFMGPVVLIGALVFAYVCAIRNFGRDPTFINAWPILFLAIITVLGFTENPLFNNHGTGEIILISILTAGGLKGWERRNGELVQVGSRPQGWSPEDVGEPATTL